jgi:transposase
MEYTPLKDDRQMTSSRPRLGVAQRRQMEWRELWLDQLIEAEHVARLVWTFVSSLDLREFYEPIQAVEGSAGQPSTDPKMLLTVWLYALIEGVRSAQRLARLCERDFAYLWICGGVSVNYHTLSDFHTQHVEALDRLLTQSVVVLLQGGLIDLKRVAQDGMRLRASAEQSSFRRGERWMQVARAHLADLKRESKASSIKRLRSMPAMVKHEVRIRHASCACNTTRKGLGPDLIDPRNGYADRWCASQNVMHSVPPSTTSVAPVM